MISWLRGAGALKGRKVPVLTFSLEGRISEDVRIKGSVTYDRLRGNYGDNAKIAVFSPWKKGLLRPLPLRGAGASLRARRTRI